MNYSLAKLGFVSHSAPKVINWYNLRHLMTKFTTVPTSNMSIAEILINILPNGASPHENGMELIRLLEPEKRGAYYGIVGLVEPDGYFSFSQNLRTVFRSNQKTYLWVGSAITQASDAMSEYKEIQIKARNTVCAVKSSAML